MARILLASVVLLACDAQPRPVALPGEDPASPGAPTAPANPAAPGATPPATRCRSFAADVEPIFTARCAFSGCHGGASPAEGLRLETGVAYASLVGVSSTQSSLPLVAPGRPEESYLLQKLGPDPARGSRMPLGASPLAAETLAELSRWIGAGAPGETFGCEATDDAPPSAPIVAIEIESGPITIAVGERVQLSAVARDAAGVVDAVIDWSNEAPAFAYLDRSGTLIGTAPGSARVRARAGGAESDPLQIEVTQGSVTAPSFEREVVPLLGSRCALSGCHVDEREAADLAFDEDARALYYDLVERSSETADGLDRVRRFDLERSFLWLKLTRPDPPAGAQMPANGDLLEAEEIEIILRWILTGAYCEC